MNILTAENAKSAEGKRKWDCDLAMRVADGLIEWLVPYCEPGYLCFAGSLRRGKLLVGDVEILFVPKTGPVRKPGEFFESESNLADLMIDGLLREGKLQKRLNEDGGTTWGPLNKLGVHRATGMPVDLFAEPSKTDWWRSLVIRTGPKELNIALIGGCAKRGITMHAYGDGFTDLKTGEAIACGSEREVFELAGMKWLEPEER